MIRSVNGREIRCCGLRSARSARKTTSMPFNSGQIFIIRPCDCCANAAL